MSIRLHFIPKLTALCTGGFIASLLLALIFIPNTRSISEEYVASYGKALATMAAKQAVDAAFNHDLVRLQVILQDVIANPHTELATIHDVENNLLVQAGDSRVRDPSSVSFNSPIALRDSIAGYVTVTVSTITWSMNSAIYLVCAVTMLFLVVALWSLFHSRALTWEYSPKSPSTPDSEAQHPENNAEEPDYESTLPPEPQSEVFAIIHIKNLNVLKQQLNGASFRETIARLEKIMSDVMALYGGHDFKLKDNYYVLNFYERDNRGEALFNASCTAYLILELAGIIDKVPLDLAALVSANKEHIVPEKLPFAGLIVEETAGAETLINRRIEFVELGTEDGRQVVSNFQQPFKSLLENQRTQLSRILHS